MSLYYEAADLLMAPTNTGGSLKSRIFGKKDLKSQPAQIYALAIETCKWSPVLKEVVHFSELLRHERKVTPVLSVLLVHDLLLAKRGIALPSTHGLRTSIERHKGRLQAEFTKARIRRRLSTLEAFKEFIESGSENEASSPGTSYPRWVRVNTLKTTLEDQLESTFAGYERAKSVQEVRYRESKRVLIDTNIPNLLAISPTIDLTKSKAYKNGEIIFQDKASCFPAYLLDPLPEDGDFIDTCSAPGNKTTHLAAILLSHSSEPEECSQTIHAYEKNKGRAETLEKMIGLAGSHTWTKIHPGQDFLRADPSSPAFKHVGALLLDPSCSGSGIIGRDDMPELHLPVFKAPTHQISKGQKNGSKPPNPSNETRKRKREENEASLDVMVDDDGEVTAVNSEDELKARLDALSKFQLELLVHAFRFPAARKITYSTCSIHAQENEDVVRKALEHENAKNGGWRILKREKQIRGLREWPVRGSRKACEGSNDLAESCIRANKDDEHGTMGFFLAAFVRDLNSEKVGAACLRDGRGHIVRDLMGIPVKTNAKVEEGVPMDGTVEEEDEWGGFGEPDGAGEGYGQPMLPPPPKVAKPDKIKDTKRPHQIGMKRPQLIKQEQKRKKGKSSK